MSYLALDDEDLDFLSLDEDDDWLEVEDERTPEDKFADRKWRLDNLYWIRDKKGNVVKFKMNAAQRKLLDEVHFLNIVLKARQMGFSTFIDILALDCAVFNSNFAVGIVADTLPNAKKLLARMKFTYNKMDAEIKAAVPIIVNNTEDVEFANGSTIAVGVSLRSGTTNFLHVSEYGKICAKFPEKAAEIKSGALNTIAPGQLVFIESTAEGRGGDFYDKTERARKTYESGRALGELDYAFHFFPWYEDETYTTKDPVALTPENEKYFKDLQDEHGIRLKIGQKWWYAGKQQEQGDDMLKEYPSTPAEAFMAAKDGSYFSKQLTGLRKLGHIGKIPFDPRFPVHTFWDLGVNDMTSIWFMQVVAGKFRFVGYYENSGEGMDFYLDVLEKWRVPRSAIWGQHYAPHDVEHRRFGMQAKSIRQLAAEAGFQFITVERTKDKLNTIHGARTRLPQCEFDEAACELGLLHLENYSRDWDDKYGVWKDNPRHDEHSHGTDGFFTFSDGFVVPTVSNHEFQPIAVA